MPLYEYECENCGERFEVLEKFSDEPLLTHVKCGGPVHRLLSAPALQFKGSGWYITDYAKSKSAAAENGAPAKSDAKTDSTKSTGSEASTSTPATSTSASDAKSSPDTKTGTKSGSETK